MSRKSSDGPVGPINPNSFYRKSVVVRHRFLGYGHSQLDEKIKVGEIDPPVALSESGRAVGWYGRYLLEKQAEREAAAERKAVQRRVAEDA
jgi:hypothetical protein